ncbi:MAG: bestrophin family ion channel [Saprospiraceae bacterium]
MHIGNNYSTKEVLFWTRKDIYLLLVISSIPVVLYQIFDLKWIAIPWLPVALLGTAVAFMVGFKNNAAYDRTWEARKIWGAIVNFSRTWGLMVKDYISNKHAEHKLSEAELHQIRLELMNRHFAWLAALRYQLREAKPWEGIYKEYNAEFKSKRFSVHEQESEMADTLRPYLSASELEHIMNKSNKAAQIIALQSSHVRRLFDDGYIEDFRHMEMEKILAEFYNQQGGSERIKNFPYPRQFTTISLWLIKIFICLLPFGMIQEFADLGSQFIWLSIPFSALSGWIFTSMEKIGEATENPFEGSANDIPITAMSRNIEIDLLEIINEPHQLKPIKAINSILT